MHRVGLRHQFGDDRVTRLVVGRVTLFLLVHNHAAALGAHQNFVLGLLEVIHVDQTLAGASGEQGRFIDQVGQIGTGHSRRSTCKNVRLDVRRKRYLAHVHDKNLFPATDVRQRDNHLTVKTTRTHQCRIKDVRTVGRSDHDDTDTGLEAVHLNQHLVQCLFAFVIATAQTRSTLAADRIKLVDKNDARRMLLGILEHVAHSCRTHTDKHFNEIGARNREERHFGFAGNRLGQQGFTGTGVADEQYAFGNAAAQLLEFGRIAQKINQFGDFLLGFVATGNIGKGDAIGRLIKQARLALAE